MSELIHGGAPRELADRLRGITEREPDHRLSDVESAPMAAGGPPTVRSFLSPYRGRLAVTFAFVVLTTVTQNVGPLIVARAVDFGILANDFRTLFRLSLLYLGVTAANMVFGYLAAISSARLGERLMERLRVTVFTHLQSLSIDFYVREKTGRIIASMVSHVDTLSGLFQDGLVSLAVQGLTLLVIAGFLLFMNVPLALVLLLVAVPAMVASTLWFRRRAGPAFLETRHRVSDVIGSFRENLAGIRPVVAHNRRGDKVLQHRQAVDRYRAAGTEASRIGSMYMGLTDGVTLAGQAVVLVVGFTMVMRQSLSIGELVAFLLFLDRFFAPIQALLGLHGEVVAGKAALTKLKEILGVQPAVEQKPDARRLSGLTGRFRLDDLSFSYGGGPTVLDRLNLEVEPGETIAFVGPTGAGKSTLAQLLVRFYDPTAGRILVDGVDLRDLDLSSYRRRVGVVPQEPFLFHGSLRQNVEFARPEASPPEVEEACRAAGLDRIAARLRNGLDSPCHERGMALSAGERQLIGLARIFLLRPDVVVLDEATSQLDLETESEVGAALEDLLGGRTAFVIAHRLASVRRADRIAVLEGGGLREIGTHDDLMTLGGRYAAMVRTSEQQGGSADRTLAAGAGNPRE